MGGVDGGTRHSKPAGHAANTDTSASHPGRSSTFEQSEPPLRESPSSRIAHVHTPQSRAEETAQIIGERQREPCQPSQPDQTTSSCPREMVLGGPDLTRPALALLPKFQKTPGTRTLGTFEFKLSPLKCGFRGDKTSPSWAVSGVAGAICRNQYEHDGCWMPIRGVGRVQAQPWGSPTPPSQGECHTRTG
ncbi:hypothetical protein Micbo1qcDRAFT_173457 [Microdochium bolleyi]|uniref:Uncharacterized protein n=1 Tax=Microdochium bolleyi TaxID=196109 RepID=A0A136JBX0_9PEZI|nr:hypothetical protein Micbo1qcDRAFT_173457 [Microdochium bolleyi]